MKTSIIAFTVLVTGLLHDLAFHFAHARLPDTPEYDDCVLQHLPGVELDLAASLIIQACTENYKSFSFTLSRRHTYNECLLEYLQGVDSTQAALEIRSACSRRYLH